MASLQPCFKSLVVWLYLVFNGKILVFGVDSAQQFDDYNIAVLAGETISKFLKYFLLQFNEYAKRQNVV